MTEIMEAPVAKTEPTPEPTPEAAAEVVAAVDAIIREARRRPATLAELKSKKPRELEVIINTADDDGDVELVLRFRAISDKAFDDLIAKHPPTAKQKNEGQTYNATTFGPALVAAVCIEPKMTEAEVTDLIESGTWSSGEVLTLTGQAMLVCQMGAGVPFTVSG
jgi:hypothetical protein